MLLVRTIVRPSRIHGLGLFADEHIAKGTKIWEFTPGFDLRFSREQLKSLPFSLQEYLSPYIWKGEQSGLYCLASDDARYFNHSSSPNCRSSYEPGNEEVVTRAARTIHRLEELTEDYLLFDSGHDISGFR